MPKVTHEYLDLLKRKEIICDEGDECILNHEFFEYGKFGKVFGKIWKMFYLSVWEHSATWKPFTISKLKKLINLMMCSIFALHDYDKSIYFDLQELWFVSDKSDSTTVFYLIYLQYGELSTIHALTGCNSSSRIVTKNKKW